MLVEQWLQPHPDTAPEDGQIFTAKTLTGPAGVRREQRIYYQSRQARARRTLRGIDRQVAKAELVAAGKVPVKRIRFLTVIGEELAVNRELKAKARAPAGLEGYLNHLLPERATVDLVIRA